MDGETASHFEDCRDLYVLMISVGGRRRKEEADDADADADVE